MKKIAKCAAAFLLSVGILAGCTSSNEEGSSNEGGDGAADAVVDEALQAELEAMYENNALENVFNTYVTAGYVAETWAYENGEEVSQYIDREQFNSAGRGITNFSETEADGDVTGAATYVDDDGPFAMCSSMPSIDFTALGVYPDGEYMATITQQWLSRDAEVLERVLSVEIDEESGSKIIVSQVVYEDSGIGIDTTYFVDAETGLLTGYEQVTYDVATGDRMYVTRANVLYNEPIEFISNPVSDVFGVEDLCNLTVVFNPGQDDEETQVFSVAKGTSVFVTTVGGYEMYNDAELTDPCDDVATDGDEAIVYVKLID